MLDHSPMSPLRPALPHGIDLAALRDIGWSCWDPLALNALDPAWRHGSAADEYDSYLVAAALAAGAGAGVDIVAAMLAASETEMMEHPVDEALLTRARTTAARIVEISGGA